MAKYSKIIQDYARHYVAGIYQRFFTILPRRRYCHVCIPCPCGRSGSNGKSLYGGKHFRNGGRKPQNGSSYCDGLPCRTRYLLNYAEQKEKTQLNRKSTLSGALLI